MPRSVDFPKHVDLCVAWLPNTNRGMKFAGPAAQRRVRSCLESLFYRLSLIIVPPPGAGSQQRPPPRQSGIRVGPKVFFFAAACWWIFRSRKPFKSALGPISNPLGFRKPPGSNLGANLAPNMKLFLTMLDKSAASLFRCGWRSLFRSFF